MIYSGEPIPIIYDQGVGAGKAYKFTVEKDVDGYTTLDGTIKKSSKRYIQIDKKYFPMVEKYNYFKVEHGLQGDWKYLVRVTKEEAEKAEKHLEKVKKDVKEEKKVEKEIKVAKKESEDFDNLLKTI